MNGEPLSISGPMPLSREKRLDRACDEFEAAWRSGLRRSIEEQVAHAEEPDRLQLLRLLVELEIELRCSNHEEPMTEEYALRFPGQADMIRAIVQGSLGLAKAQGSTIDSESTLVQAKAAVSGARPTGTMEETNQGQVETLHSADFPTLAKYKLLAEVGRGAMGVVYRARHRILEKHVAIKVLLPGRSRERFLREAKLLATVGSPHVVAVHDFDVFPDGSPMLCMDWVEGRTLHQAMEAQGGFLPEDVAMPWMRQVCEGMEAAAERGVIHRDLKPSNILIDTRGQARVADFGLARGPESTSELSQPGDVMGTPHYMAPEQAEDPRSVDTRADIYSFGATFYHALTGRRPFEGETMFSILYKHKTEPLISPKARRPDLSERVNDLLERCLAKVPADRFSSFAEVRKHLLPTANPSSPWLISDDEQLTAYLVRYQSRRRHYLSEWRADEDLDVYTFPRGQVLRIRRGDIVKQKVDALVSSDTSYLGMHGGVSAAIRRAAGVQILQHARDLAPVRPGRAAVTLGGNLSSRLVFHGITVGVVEGKLVRVRRHSSQRGRPGRD